MNNNENMASWLTMDAGDNELTETLKHFSSKKDMQKFSQNIFLFCRAGGRKSAIKYSEPGVQ